MIPFPLFRMRDGRVRFGPYLIDTDSGAVEFTPWPEWMDRVLPRPSAVLPGRSPWEPVSFSAWMNGCAWLIRIWGPPQNAWPGKASVLFLSDDGDLVRKVDLPKPDFDAGREIQVFREWALAFGTLIRDGKAVGSTHRMDWDVVRSLMQGMAILGPDGALLLPDGQRVAPDRSRSAMFDPEEIRGEVSRAAGWASGSGQKLQMDLLGWDERSIWVLAGIAGRKKGILKQWAISRISLSGDRPDSMEIVFRSDTRASLHTVRLGDGGWAIQVIEELRKRTGGFPKTRFVTLMTGDRVIFRPPGMDEVFAHEAPKGADPMESWRRIFAPDRDGGLLAVLDAGTSEKCLLLWMCRDAESRAVQIMKSPADRLERIFSNGWEVLRENGKPAAVYVRYPKTYADDPPGNILDDRDFAYVIRERTGWEDVDITIFRAFEETVLAWGSSRNPQRGFVASFRIADGRPEPVNLIPLPKHPDPVEHLEEGNGAMIFFFRMERFPSKVAVLMNPDGALSSTVVS